MAREPGWPVSRAGGASRWKVMARSESGGDRSSQWGRRCIRRRAGMVTSSAAAEGEGLSVAGIDRGGGGRNRTRDVDGVKCSGVGSEGVGEMHAQRSSPPMERWTICRRVASRRSSAGRAFCGSGICCEAPQVAIQSWCVLGLAKAGAFAKRDDSREAG